MQKTSNGIGPSTLIILAGVSAALHVGKLAPALPALQQTLHVSLLQSAFLISLVQLAGMTLGLFVGLSADALGLRRCMLTGLAVLTICSAMGATVQTVTSLLVLRALEGVGFLLVVMPAPAMIRQVTPAHQLKPRLGWWGAYMPLGSAIALLLGPLILERLGWPVWWCLAAALSGLACVAVAMFVPARYVSTQRPDVATGWLSQSRRLKLTLQSRGAWLVALTFAAYSSQWIAVIGFLPSMYLQAGLSSRLTGVLTAAVALANVTGNILSGNLLQRGWRAQRILKVGFVCMALGGFGAFAQWNGETFSMPVRFACIAAFSAVGGLIPGTLFSMAVRVAPSDATVSTTVGWMQQCSSLGQFAGPPLIAAVAGLAGGWNMTWIAIGMLCTTGTVLAALLGRVDAGQRG